MKTCFDFVIPLLKREEDIDSPLFSVISMIYIYSLLFSVMSIIYISSLFSNVHDILGDGDYPESVVPDWGSNLTCDPQLWSTRLNSS